MSSLTPRDPRDHSPASRAVSPPVLSCPVPSCPVRPPLCDPSGEPTAQRQRQKQPTPVPIEHRFYRTTKPLRKGRGASRAGGPPQTVPLSQEKGVALGDCIRINGIAHRSLARAAQAGRMVREGGGDGEQAGEGGVAIRDKNRLVKIASRCGRKNEAVI